MDKNLSKRDAYREKVAIITYKNICDAITYKLFELSFLIQDLFR